MHAWCPRFGVGVLCAVLGLGCTGSDSDAADGGRDAAGATFCAEYADFARGLGCARLSEANCQQPAPSCQQAALAWLECLRDDPSQCYCEKGDGSLNCEGSYKPSEGPARCVAEFAAVDSCLDGQ